MNNPNLAGFTDVLGDEIDNSQESLPLSLSLDDFQLNNNIVDFPESSYVSSDKETLVPRPAKGTGQYGQFRSVDEVDVKYRSVFSYPYFNMVQSGVIEDALYSDKSMVICAPTGSGKTVVFEMAIVQLLMEIEDKHDTDDFKIIYMAPVKALCTERLTDWYRKFTRLGLLCIEVTGDTDVDFAQLKPYRIIITTPEKWDMVTRRWREHRQLVEVIKLFLIDEVHILNDESRGPVLEAVVSRMKTIESSAQSAHRIEQLQRQYQGTETTGKETPPKIRFVAVSATVSNPQDVAAWLGTTEKPAVYYKFGDESRPVKLKRVVEGFYCPEGTSIFKFDIILNYKLWPIIQKYHNGKPTLIFCNTRKSVTMTAETLIRELTVTFNPEQKAKLTALASTIKNKKLQALVLNGVGCHHAGLLFEERTNIEQAFRNRDLPILITTTTLAMGVNLPAHLVIIKNTQQYVNGAYQEYSISTILQMVGRAGRPQFDTEATAVIMTRLCDKSRYQSLVGGSEPLQSYLHKRLAENLNSEAALGTVNDVAQCVQWLRSTFLSVRAARDPKRYLGLPQAAPQQLISKKIEELCVKAMNGLATSGLITMDEASCIESTEAGRLMSVFYLDLETMKHIMKINGSETLERLLWVICESHELADMHLRVDERRCLNTLNRNNAAATIRFPMRGKISSRQMKLNCIIQATLGCLNIPDPSLNQEAMKIMRIAHRVCKCLVAYVTRPALICQQPKYYSAVLNSLILTKCVAAHLWENSGYVSKQLKGIGPTFSTLLATAGKVSFMLLEESHPRDLERIMNKGPPAGNVLRKQISLLPKYQITMTPIDEKSVTIQLVLLNQNYLAENTEHLTAGDTHKSYVVVGDSENNLLLFTPFTDKDLISIYDGTIVHKIARKHSFEHKVYAHCISSSFVGIDVQCEYLFKDLEALNLSTNVDPIRKPASKQSIIPDTIKERKRKNTSGNDITQSKEKKKRDSALFEKFKSLKESFGKTSKDLKEDLNKSAVISNRILQELNQLEKPTKSIDVIPLQINDYSNIKPMTEIDFDQSSLIEEMNTEVNENDAFVDDERFNSILNEIENEISKGNHSLDLPQVNHSTIKNTESMQSPLITELSSTSVPQRNNNLGIDNFKAFNNMKKRTQKNIKSHYNFIDLLEKNLNLSDDEETPVCDRNSGFSDAIKSNIEKYLRGTKSIPTVPDTSITELLQTNNTNKNNEDKTVPKQATNIHDIATIESNRKDNETPHELQNILGVNLIKTGQNEIEAKSVSTENDDRAVKLVTESKNHYVNCADTETNDNNYAVSAGITTIDSNNCGSNVNATYDTVKPCSKTNMNTTENIDTQDDVTVENEDNFKTHDSIVLDDAKALIPVISQDINEELETEYHSLSETTATPNTNKYSSTYSFALRYNQSHPPAYSLNPEANSQIFCEENKRNLILKPNFAKLTSTNNSEQFSSLSEDIYETYANTSNQNLNVRKRSYSTTQIDIATKNDHVLNVIRMIKMDLNITEIFPREGSRLIEIEDDLQHEGKCNTENSIKDFKSPEEPRRRTQDGEVKNAIIPYYKGSVNNMITGDIQDDFKKKIKQAFVTPKLTLPSSQFKPQNKQIKQVEYNNCNTEVKNVKENIVANEKSSTLNTSPRKEGNQIENILQKYSKILRKNNTGSLIQSVTQPKVMEKDFYYTPLEKPKRPFKIVDIHNSNIPLPNILISETHKRENLVEPLIEISEQENVTAVENEIEEFSYQRVEPNDVNFQNPSESIESLKDSNTKQSLFQDEDLDIFEEVPNYNLLDIEEVQPQPNEIDYNIDQSMLNPKTLLQCLSNDIPDDILPPPAEFCDENNFKPNDADLTVPMDCYEPTLWNNFYDSNNQTIESILQDDSHIELTPRKEIETWALSQYDESYEKLAASTSTTPIHTFTITHNSGQHKSPFQNVSVSRPTRLGQFKFSRKSKYLPKK